jgi:putative peptidoglycan lipid II flippase
VITAFILSNLAGLARQILVANQFGTMPELDAFNAANRVSETLFNLVAGGALGSAFIPTFTGLLTQEKRRRAWELACAVANWLLILLIVLSLITYLLAPQVVRYLLASGFAADPAQEALTIDLLRLMLPSAFLFGLSGLVMGILNSHQVFFIPALTPSMYQFGLIFGVLGLAPRMGIRGLAWGVVLGAALHLALQIPSLLHLRGEYIPNLGGKLPELREVILLMGPRLLGQAVVQLNFWVNTNLASFQPEGSVAGIQFGFALMLMPQAAIAQSVATAAMPTLAAQYARGKLDEVSASLAASLRGVLLLSIPASLGLILLRTPLVATLYQRGQFNERSTELVAWSLLWYSAGLVGHCLVEVLARAFYALHNTRTPVAVGIAAMGLNILLSFVLSRAFANLGWMPLGGLALANSLATGLEAMLLLILIRRRLNGIDGLQLAKGSLQALAGAMVMTLGLAAWLALANSLANWLLLTGGILLGGTIYGLGMLILKVPEAHSLVYIVRKRLARSER